MAPGGVVAHSSSWTPAACELEESSPPSRVLSFLDIARDRTSRRKMGARGQGCVHSDGSDRWQRRGYRGGVKDILVLPAVTVVSRLPGPPLRGEFSHVLGLRIVVPGALWRLSGQLLRQRQSGPLQTLWRLLCQLLRQPQLLVDSSILEPLSRSLLCWFTRSVRELFARPARATLQRVRRRLAMTRPRASCSSSHRDDRWEGCRVRGGILGQKFSWTRTALNLEAWTPRSP